MYRERLRDLIDRDDLLQCPGVHDPLTAAVADDVGFDAIYMTDTVLPSRRPDIPTPVFSRCQRW